jgi:hypothetical protein
MDIFINTRTFGYLGPFSLKKSKYRNQNINTNPSKFKKNIWSKYEISLVKPEGYIKVRKQSLLATKSLGYSILNFYNPNTNNNLSVNNFSNLNNKTNLNK